MHICVSSTHAILSECIIARQQKQVKKQKQVNGQLQWRSQNLEGGGGGFQGQSMGEGGGSGHAEDGCSRGVWGHAPPEKIWKMASLRLFLAHKR